MSTCKICPPFCSYSLYLGWVLESVEHNPKPEPEPAQRKPAHARTQQPPCCIDVVVHHIVVVIVVVDAVIVVV